MRKSILSILIYFFVFNFALSQNSLKWVVEGALHTSTEAVGTRYSFNEFDINNVNYDKGIDPILWGTIHVRTSSGVLDSADFEILVDDLQINTPSGKQLQLMVYSADSSMDFQTEFHTTPLSQFIRLRFNLFEYGTRTNTSYVAGTGGIPKNMPIGFSGPNQNFTSVTRLHAAEVYYFENPAVSTPIPCVVIDSCMQIDTFITGEAFSDINTGGEDIDATALSQAKINGTYPYDVTGGRTYIHTMEVQNICDNNGNNNLAVSEASYNVFFPEASSFIIGRQDIKKSNTATGRKSSIGFALSPSYEPITLPIELNQWRTKVENENDVHLFWSTVSEINNDKFEIEHSLDGINFSLLETIKGAGTSTEVHYYHHKIENLQKGVHYFRLKQIDYDGTTTYSSIKAERIEGDVKQIHVYPSILQKTSALYVETNESGRHQIEIYTMAGQLIHSFSQNLNPIQANALNVDLSNDKSGLYLLKIEHESMNHVVKIQLR